MELDNDVKINLNFVQGGKYHMSVYINDQNFAIYSIINSQKVQITTSTLVNYCDTRMNQVCKLTINILSEEPDKESVLDIRVHNYNIVEVIPPNDTQEKSNNTSSSFAVGLGISLSIIIVILIIAIILLLKCMRKGNYIDMPEKQELIMQD